MFVKRAVSSVVLVLIALVTILAGGPVLALVLAFISMAAYRELLTACKIKSENKINILEIAGYIEIAVYYLLVFFHVDSLFLLLTLICGLVLFMFIYVVSFPKYQSEQIMSSVFSILYAPVMLSCIYMTRELSYGVYVVWMIFISSWICDTCAYLVGSVLGRHKLAPILSPHKSIEGAIGGVVGSALVGAVFGFLLVENVIPEKNITWIFALISAIGAIISQIGDLAASAIKRNHDVKDYGKLIPGHGGIMDRFDSVIFTAPMILLLAKLMLDIAG